MNATVKRRYLAKHGHPLVHVAWKLANGNSVAYCRRRTLIIADCNGAGWYVMPDFVDLGQRKVCLMCMRAADKEAAAVERMKRSRTARWQARLSRWGQPLEADKHD